MILLIFVSGFCTALILGWIVRGVWEQIRDEESVESWDRRRHELRVIHGNRVLGRWWVDDPDRTPRDAA